MWLDRVLLYLISFLVLSIVQTRFRQSHLGHLSFGVSDEFRSEGATELWGIKRE